MSHSCACRTQGDLRVGHTGELGDRETRVPPPPEESCVKREPRCPHGKGQFCGSFAWDQIWMRAKVDAVTKVGVRRRCRLLPTYFEHLLLLDRRKLNVNS